MPKPKRIIFLVIFTMLLTLFSSCMYSGPYTYRPETAVVTGDSSLYDGLFVLFMDVGQADAILIIQGEHAMLVDTAAPEYADIVTGKLREYGVTSLDALVLTHPHSDHIGSASDVIKAFDVERIFMPRALTFTKLYERLLDTIIGYDLPVTAPSPGEKYTLGGAEILFLSPPSDTSYDDMNSYSIAFIIEYGGVRMLFTGDMLGAMEKLVLNSGFDISCDLIKIAHHGSKTSSSSRFIEAAGPKWAIMTTSVYTTHNLPNPDIVKRWEDVGVTIYCTGEVGEIIAEVRDGKLTVSTR